MSAVESVLHEQMCTLATMQRVARRLSTPGRPWARRFLAVVEGRIDGAARESGWECKVVDDAVSDSGVRNLATQHRIEVGPGRAVRFDIALPARALGPRDRRPPRNIGPSKAKRATTGVIGAHVGSAGSPSMSARPSFSATSRP